MEMADPIPIILLSYYYYFDEEDIKYTHSSMEGRMRSEKSSSIN
jgi:hypothetical protein